MEEFNRQRLKQLRKGAGKTFRQLSEDTGLSVSLLQKLEGGQRTPSPEAAEKLADYFQVSPDYFYTPDTEFPICETEADLVRACVSLFCAGFTASTESSVTPDGEKLNTLTLTYTAGSDHPGLQTMFDVMAAYSSFRGSVRGDLKAAIEESLFRAVEAAMPALAAQPIALPEQQDTPDEQDTTNDNAT